MHTRRLARSLALIGTVILTCTLPGDVWGQAATVVPVHQFSGSDGAHPRGALIRATDGFLYGTTAYGGLYNGGTAFRLSLDGTHTRLYSFNLAGPDECGPWAGLLAATNGYFYGTTYMGGTCWEGTAFRMSAAGTVTTLHTFCGSTGRYALFPLIQAGDGVLYGTTKGSVFRMSLAGSVVNLHGFATSEASSGLVLGRDGYLYGTTRTGGASGKGTVYRITTGGTFTELHSFNGLDGASPGAELVEGADGYFYGSTTAGGTWDKGSLFRMSPDGTVTTLHSFAGPDGRWAGPVVFGRDGDLYGVTRHGGTVDRGTIFRYRATGELTTLHAFDGPHGSFPWSALLEVADGEFYGVADGGGTTGEVCFSGGCGLVFRLTLPRANLRVTAIKAPAAVASGAGFSVTDTTKNDGPGSANPSDTAIWLSTNKTLGGDTELATRDVPTLAAGALNAKATSLTLPTLAPGVYYLIVQADTDGEVAEANENDNLKVKTLTVGPDLLPATMTFSPPVPTSTTPTTITVTTKNNGGDTAVESVTRLYRSADARIGVGDSLLTEWLIPALSPKGTSVNAVTVTLPAGTYYLIAQVDATNTVVEAKETNNLKKVKKTVP